MGTLNQRLAVSALLALAFSQLGAAQAEDAAPADAPPVRPTILFNRWQEDWSVLADPRVPREPLDALKYIPLSPTDPETYLSFGANIRERFETNDAAQFGTAGNHAQNYVISRTELFADLHLVRQLEGFVELQSDFAPDKTRLAPVDRDRADIEQAFVVLTEPVADGTVKLRLGRQQFAFDLQRFVSVRDGPNVRQSYDAVWADYETSPWRLIAFYSQPVQTRDGRAFDDFSNGHLTFSVLRLERKLTSTVSLSAYYSHYTQDGARYLSVRGDERRENFDVHLDGTAANFDWDVEGMGQFGSIAGEDIEAWGVGSLGGYTFAELPWTPRLGLQIDAASGDDNPHDRTLETFNPLFPNGAYVTLAGYTGYTNFVQAKPSVTIHPFPGTKLMFAAALQYRETAADAVYTQPNIPVRNTAGRGDLYTGTYGQIRLDWAVSRSTAVAVEAVHFQAGDVILRAGGRNSDYVGVELKYGW